MSHDELQRLLTLNQQQETELILLRQVITSLNNTSPSNTEGESGLRRLRSAHEIDQQWIHLQTELNSLIQDRQAEVCFTQRRNVYVLFFTPTQNFCKFLFYYF